MSGVIYVVYTILKRKNQLNMTNLFNNVELSPPVEVFALVAAYNDDNHDQKVNLGIGGNCPRAQYQARSVHDQFTVQMYNWSYSWNGLNIIAENAKITAIFAAVTK